ncbi:MAG: alpha/beta hydrolase [Pseudomonadota bacterium]
MTTKLFVHGVPDSPEVWRPLLTSLGESVSDTDCLALPGFVDPPPSGFVASKDAYADWLVAKIEHAARHGPVDIVGHDWGALLTLRAASLRPDLVRSWVISGAVIHPDYRGHQAARAWNTPLLGEFVMSRAKPKALAEALHQAGLNLDIAEHDASLWTRSKRQCILRLYRSAKRLRFKGDWVDRLADLPKNGLVIWGEMDPYVDLSYARSFASEREVDLMILTGAGHWAVAQRADQVASRLKAFWETL